MKVHNITELVVDLKLFIMIVFENISLLFFENINTWLNEHIVQTLLGWGNSDSWLKFAHTHMIRAILAYQSERPLPLLNHNIFALFFLLCWYVHSCFQLAFLSYILMFRIVVRIEIHEYIESVIHWKREFKFAFLNLYHWLYFHYSRG